MRTRSAGRVDARVARGIDLDEGCREFVGCSPAAFHVTRSDEYGVADREQPRAVSRPSPLFDPENNLLPDLLLRERIALWPTAIMALAMGVAPLLWLNTIDPAVHNVLAPFTQLASRMVGQ